MQWWARVSAHCSLGLRALSQVQFSACTYRALTGRRHHSVVAVGQFRCLCCISTNSLTAIWRQGRRLEDMGSHVDAISRPSWITGSASTLVFTRAQGLQ
ncbi:hypothetical protein PF011_g3053 [Phytophthora fragariae]|uniref:Secreted protein n=1 Tax=Phytophthora fragariae TaxID=53985 RepID=A0A6A3MAZ2_9STRA|nr:hypothetical protein PF011_g3053 [Phytophthora fragariae]KAE9358487.1 hypothetical protein PF008_g2666 [Phytophthora fragariae]